MSQALSKDLGEALHKFGVISLMQLKRAVEAATHLSLRDGLMYEATGQTECMRSADMREAITAFVEGRTPEYGNR